MPNPKPGKTPKKLSQGELAAPCAGFDRDTLRDPDVKSTVLLVDWMDEMHRRSNFSFCGVYLKDSKNVPPEAKKGELTTSAADGDNGYLDIYPELEKQGWGMVYFYLGYTFRWDHTNLAPPELLEHHPDGPPTWKVKIGQENKMAELFPKSLARSRGILHAKHVKLILSKMTPDTRGAVIYLDDEGSWTGIMSPLLLAYYQSFFLELARPGQVGEPDAVRPGIYAIKIDARQIAQQEGLEDLFIWHLDYNHKGTIKWTGDFNSRQTKRPWQRTPGKLTVDMQDFPVTNIENVRPKKSQTPITALSVGRQALLNELYKFRCGEDWDVQDPKCELGNWTKQERARASIKLPGLQEMSKVLQPVDRWDISISLVRDPRYPVANPRIQANGSTILRGDYRNVIEKADPQLLPENALTMVIRDAQIPDSTPVEEKQVEPEAPILLPTPDTLLTITKSGEIAMSVRNGGKWSTMVLIGRPAVPLRRIRAMAAVNAGSYGLHLFYITADRHIQARRQLPDGGWTDAGLVAGTLNAHPFSNLTCSFFGDRIWVYFIDRPGLLHYISFQVSASDWSDVKHGTLEAPQQPKPASDPLAGMIIPDILAGTAITSVSPSPEYQLVFVVGRDLTLRTAVYVGKSQTWTSASTSLTPVDKGPDNKLFAHSRLASFSDDPKVVMVAGINSEGHPSVYRIRDVQGVWMVEAGGRVAYPRVPVPPPTTKKPVDLVKDARSYNVNPFGDVAFALKDGKKVLLCAGTAPGKTSLLVRSIEGAGDWEKMVDVGN